MIRKYYIGNSHNYGNLVAVSTDNLLQVSKDFFFKEIKNSIIKYNMEKHQKDANLIKNLKQGVSIGYDYYLIKDKRK